MVHEAYPERHFSRNEHRSERPRAVADMLESEEMSRALLERARWPEGPVCPSCGAKNAASRLSTRPGLWTCKACRRCQYSVTSGTHLHRSRLPVSVWVKFYHLTHIANRTLTASQVSRRYNVAYLTAKSMLRRIEAMKTDRPEMMERLETLLRDLEKEAGQC